MDPNDILSESYSLGGMITEICDRVGMPPGTYDVTQLEGSVEGMLVSSNNAAFTYIRALSEVFLFDPSNTDGVLKFIPRGGDIVATIDSGDILEDVDEEEELERKDSLVVPRVLHLQYMDTLGGLQTDLQQSDRSADNRSTGELSTQTPVILRTNDAQQAAVIAHKIAIEEQQGEYHISLPNSYIDLTVGDIIQYDGERLRIFEVLVEDGFQRYKAAFDRQSAYTSVAIGMLPALTVTPTLAAPGPTRLELLDIPIISAADDNLGYYVAVSGQRPSWAGARVSLSTDGGQNYTDSSTTTDDTVMGSLTTSLPAHSVDYPDQTNVFQVKIQTPNTDIQTATLTEMMNRANLCLVGRELINVGNATEVSPGVWEFSDLLRGRKGTDAESHPAGVRFLVLERQYMAFIPTEAYNIGQRFLFKATSLGSTNTVIEEMFFSGQSQTERQVGYLSATRDGNDVTVSWQGVGRLGGKSQPVHGQHFTGYRVEVDGQTIDTQSTTETITVSAGAHLLRVYQRNAFTGNGPAAEITA